ATRTDGDTPIVRALAWAVGAVTGRRPALGGCPARPRAYLRGRARDPDRDGRAGRPRGAPSGGRARGGRPARGGGPLLRRGGPPVPGGRRSGPGADGPRPRVAWRPAVSCQSGRRSWRCAGRHLALPRAGGG